MVQDNLTFLAANFPWLVGIVVAAFAGAQVERYFARRAREQSRRRWSEWRQNKQNRKAPASAAKPGDAAGKREEPPPFDPAEQLRHVERASFKTVPLLNKAETRLFGVIERACVDLAPDWRVMAQVSLGEILSSPNGEAYRAINSKRVDLLIVGPNGHALHAIEYQGSGHHLGPAATRDAVKKEALRKAGVGYVEVKSGDTPAEIKAQLAKLAGGTSTNTVQSAGAV